MLFSVKSSVIAGLEARTVDVEVSAEEGKPAYVIIGMGDTAVRESRDRVLSALKSSGFRPSARILVNLAPAELKKEGASFDLAIAVGILGSSGRLPVQGIESMSFHGELSLDGSIKPVKGVVAHAVEALQRGARELIVPRENAEEAALVSGIEVTGVRSLAELIAYLEGELVLERAARRQAAGAACAPRRLSEVRGQRAAKRALLIAAAGGHNLLMVGPPGCGKSMLAERFPSILPPLSHDEMLQIVKIPSVAGLHIDRLLDGDRPFRNPHYVISEAGLIGGGSAPRPGEVSLAHRGVLFLDEFPEFRRGALEGLRQPLEAGRVRVSRAKGSVDFPADFQLLAAMNPCPCGRLNSAASACVCSRSAIYSYLRKLSLPILDRIDLHVDVEAVPLAELQRGAADEHGDDCTLRGRVSEARLRALQRAGCLNARLASGQIEACVKPTDGALALLKRFACGAPVSARGYFRILKVARSIADLADRERVEADHVAEAAGFRCLERIERYAAGGAAA